MTDDQITRIKTQAQRDRYLRSPKGRVMREYEKLRRRRTCVPIRAPEYPRLTAEQLRREANKMMQQQYDELVLQGFTAEEARGMARDAAGAWVRKVSA